MKLMCQIVILLLAAGVPATLAAVLHPKPPRWHDDQMLAGHVDAATVRSWKKVLWIDARSPTAFLADHVPGALPLAMTSWDQQIQAVIEAWVPGRPVVVYCAAQACQDSVHVAELLRRDYALPDVYVLQDGWAAWHQP